LVVVWVLIYSIYAISALTISYERLSDTVEFLIAENKVKLIIILFIHQGNKLSGKTLDRKDSGFLSKMFVTLSLRYTSPCILFYIVLSCNKAIAT
jgi:hypothetical protein